MDFININNVIIHYQFLTCLSPEYEERTFVFINSLGTDFRIWDEVTGSLNGYGNILLFDNRGHGLSDVVAETDGLSDFTDDVIALMEKLSIKKCIPVGLSLGGMIAQLLAYRKPEMIEKIVLCDTRHKIGTAEIWNERIAGIKEKGMAPVAEGVMLRWFTEKFRSEDALKVSGCKNMLERTPVVGYIKACEAVRDADLTEIAKQIKTSALCIVGSGDIATPPDQVKNLADLIEGSKFEVIEGSGHIPCMDNPEALSKLIIDFSKV